MKLAMSPRFHQVAAAGILMLAVAAATSGCKRTNHQTVIKKVETTTQGMPATGSGIVQTPAPGPWKTLEVKNEDGSVLEALQARGEVGEFGGMLKLSTFGSGPKTFNPWAAADVESNGIGLLLFEQLVDIDPWTGKLYPRLAKSYTISPDNLQYTFVLRKGLQWSDGKPITADDVVFTYNTIIAKGYGNSSARDVLSVNGKFPKVEKIDDLTIRFTTAGPFAPFLNSLRQSIAPKHILEPVTKKALDQFPAFWDINTDPSKMVFGGAFMLEQYRAGERVELKRNPKYFMVDSKGQRLPYLDRFSLSVVPSQKTQVTKFYGNELDMLDVRSVPGYEVALMKQKEPNGNFKMYNLGPDDGTVFLMFNMCQRKSPKGKYYVPTAKQKWFNNQNFRQAVSHAINREQIVDNVLKGVGTPLYTSESPASIFFNSNLKPYPQDLEFSAKLLKDAGFVKKPDGRLFDADGNPVEFTLFTNAGNTTRDGICVSIVDELKKLGMKVNYQPIDFNIMIDKTENSLDWEAIVMGLSGSKTEPYDGANVWKSEGRLHMFDQRIPVNGVTTVTDARPWEKKIDELFNRGATELDFAKRKATYDECQKIAYEQQPFIYIESPLDITALRNSIANYQPTPLGVLYTPKGSLHNIEEIYFRKQ